MKKIIALLLALVMVLGLVACGAKTETSAETPAASNDTTSEAAPTSDVTYAIVPKSAGNPYNEREASGFEQACADLGVKCIVQYPEDTSAEAQINVINNLIAQGVNAIAVAANDAEALESTLESAKKSGIVVVSLDSDAKGSQLFVNQAGVSEVAQVLVDSVYDMAGGAGQFAVLSASSTATNQNSWIAAMEQIIAADSKYADLEWVETVYGDDESQKSYDMTESLMTNYPDLKVICCPTTVGVLACAQAVQNAGSAIKVAGLGLPSEMNGYVGEDLPCPYMYLWNPIDVGATAAYAIQCLADGATTGAVGESFTAANGNTYEVLDGDTSVGVYSTQIIVGPPYEFTADNIAEWATVY
ncbi:MAG: substrate-binding domain-containing protein [Candidatus Avoscillospira sp.]